MARRTIATPTFSSPSRFFTFSSAFCARSNATPPPGTMPSSTAARVVCSASSTRAFFSFISVSVAAPTLMTATPPASFARRSCNCSLRHHWFCWRLRGPFARPCFRSCELFDHGEDVITVEDFVFLAVQFDFSAAVFADQHAVALPDFEGNFLAIVAGLAGAERHNPALHRFFLGSIGNDDPALLAFRLFLFERFHENPIAQGSNF